MSSFSYKSHSNLQQLFIENVAIADIAKKVGTPFYCYSKQVLIENFKRFATSFHNHKIANHKICYAIKANCNLHLVKILAGLGSGIDAVSGGEIFFAIKAGINPKKIVFAGVGKTYEEISYALQQGVEEFSVESEAEMFILNKAASDMGKKAKFSLRVNPDVDAKTHDKISTGRKGDKFGVNINQAAEIYSKAAKLPGLEVYGISTHIGSQITKLEPFRLAFAKLRDLCLLLRKNGHKISHLDFGGGIGILYRNEETPLIEDYIGLIKETIAGLDVGVTIAPGRAIIGNSGMLITKVVLLKEVDSGNAYKNFAIIDAAMNDLMRPGLYGAYHEVLPVINKTGQKHAYDLAGPICETTDVLANNRILPELHSEDLLAFGSAGAYGSSMSNEYNCRPLIPEVLVDGDKFEVIRRRPTLEEMTKLYS